MFNTIKSRTFLHEQLITNNHGPQACKDFHCKEWRKGLTQWYPKLAGRGVFCFAKAKQLPGTAPLGQEGKPRAANTKVTLPQPQLHYTSGPQGGPGVTPGNSRGALRMKKVPCEYLFPVGITEPSPWKGDEERPDASWLQKDFTSPHCPATFVIPL